MKREKCIYCKKVDIPIDKVIHDNWDRLCHWCILEFEGFFNYNNLLDRKE